MFCSGWSLAVAGLGGAAVIARQRFALMMSSPPQPSGADVLVPAPVPKFITRARGFVLQLVGGEGQMSCAAALFHGL